MAEATATPVGGSVVAEARWSAADDVLLKDALQQTGDFDRTAKSVKFSVRMTARELEQRWQQLLYNEALAAQAATAMATAPPPKRVMWTEAEEETLMREASKREFRGFMSLLENPTLRPIFHSTRTAKSMEAHYYRMKSRAAKAAAAAAGPNAEEDGDEEKAGGDGDTAVEDRPEENFSDVEDQLADELASPPALMDKAATRAYKKEMQKLDRVQQRNVLQQEKDVEKEKEKDRDTRTLALLRGRRIRHVMRTKEIVIGRAPSAAEAGNGRSIDVDLWEEGDASKVSRQQATLKLKKDCEFYIKNISSTRPLLVNGHVVAPGKKRHVPDGAVVECGRLEMLLEVNKPLIGRIKRQLQV